jgi:Helitron helicase-like domain at N-terminus
VPLGRDRWGKLLLQHLSRRFQSHPMFAATCFNSMRLDRSSIGVKVQASYKAWQKTNENLESVTEQQLMEASAQSKNHQHISNPAVRELLRLVSRIGTHAPGSDAKESCMLVQLKSTIMKHGLPLIFLTLNPGVRDSQLALYYAGADIDMKGFDPDQYPDEKRLSIMMDNPSQQLSTCVAVFSKANHDVQFLYCQVDCLGKIYYVVKYVTEQEDELHSKLTIAAAVRKEWALQKDADREANTSKSFSKKVIHSAISEADRTRYTTKSRVTERLVSLRQYRTCSVSLTTTQTPPTSIFIHLTFCSMFCDCDNPLAT